jgi:hypothetical protein
MANIMKRKRGDSTNRFAQQMLCVIEARANKMHARITTHAVGCWMCWKVIKNKKIFHNIPVRESKNRGRALRRHTSSIKTLVIKCRVLL